MDFTYNGVPLFIKTPNLGHLEDDFIAIRHMIDHKENPPFGIPQEPERVTWDSIRDGGINSNFPHAYINLCPSRNETRLIPVSEDGKVINTPGELFIHFKFTAAGAATNATYFIYLCFTDVNYILDMKMKTILPYYKNIRSAF